MLFRDKWLNTTFLRSPETEAGTDIDAGGAPPPAPAERPSGPGSGRSSLRQSLEKSFDDAREAAEPEERDESGRFKPGHQVGKREKAADAAPAVKTAPSEAPEADEAPPEVDAAPEVEADVDEEPETPKTAPPDGWTKEAKAEWAKLPAPVQAAVTKRESDVAKGVKELQERYADIDRSLEPHLQAIRQHGHTPAQAVDQLFGWFRALAVNPDVAFPALMESFKYDSKRLSGAAQPAPAPGQPAPAPTAAQPGQQPPGEVPSALQDYINAMQSRMEQMEQTVAQQLGGFQQTFQQQQQAKTEETLAMWAKDKPYFEEVRPMMAHLIGSGAIPLKEGKVDLDSAYDAALYANKEVRQKVLAEDRAKAAAERKAKLEAEKKAQTEQAAKATKASAGLGQNAPGTSSGATPANKNKGKSIRESLNDAMEELRS